MQITLCIPTIRRFDTLQRCVDSALASPIAPTKILIMDNSAGQLKAYDFHNKPVYIHTPSYNWGCARAWNWFMQQNEDLIVICNDDVEFNDRTLPSIVEAYQEDSNRFIAPCAGANIFSCFLLPKKVYEQVGPFDEQFWPAYFEDNDYSMRVTQTGIPFCFTGAGYGHVGSATLASYTSAEKAEHNRQFAANRQRFQDKWGRLP